MYHAFATNVIDLLFLGCVSIWMDLSLNKKYSRYIMGFLFGFITIFLMHGHIIVGEGRFFDFRHISLTMAGFIGGPSTAVIAALMSLLYRFIAGGNSAVGGIANIIIFASFGIALGHYFKNKKICKKAWFLLLIGMIMSCILLCILEFISPWLLNPNIPVSGTVIWLFLITTPLLVLFIFKLYFWTYDYLSKALILDTIINKSSINLIIFNDRSPILYSDAIKKQCHSHPFSDPAKIHSHREFATKDGRHYITDLSTFQMPSGENACAAIFYDITDHKQDQEQLRVATDRFKKAFQLGPHMMSIIRKSDLTYIDVNDRFLKERDFRREDIIGKTPIEIGVPESQFYEIIKSIELQGSVRNIECSTITKLGFKKTIIISAETIQIDGQECILFAYNNVTEMKRLQTEKLEQLQKYLILEADLSRSNQLIAGIINSMPDSFYVLDDQDRFIYINNQAEELLQKSRETLLGQVCWDHFPQVRGTLLECYYNRAKNDGLSFTLEYESILLQDKWYQITGYPSQFGISVYYQDLTEQKLACEKLSKSKEETISVLESMTDSFFSINEDWQFTYINCSAEKAFGKSREELLGKKLTDEFKLHETSLLNYQTAMDENRSFTYEIISEMLGNKWVEIKLYPIENGLSIYFQDISSRKKSEEEMARLDRLNLVGQLAAGIGHEIRNPLTTIRGYLQLIGDKPDYAILKPTFDLMISEVDRANSIITEFLSLAQTKKTELKLQNLNDILDQLYPLLQADALSQNKQLRFILGYIPTLELNAKEITQLILNLTRNGFEAMAERGCLTIESYLQDGKVVLAIDDEGCGIPPENSIKIGTPFFTTKDTGTGLGLATCYRIVEAHGAKICVDSSSSGTTFYISFPIPDKEQNANHMIA
ncbi:PAS domain S-box [Desulfosporosinus orientis DSM 765]|uniref:histidine kinase n=1 Tax=Desulfosporosinus orientis (strain ATCC 19365 / DSM 765 / NCIMB 8382 / VKM B-1628 / Singapore I) TaxID=768706 RepID=G7WBV8_DESOD|nr:PAS domain S-box [Desulfosporosinus orientis DSM 765]